MQLSDSAVKQGDEVQLSGLTQELRLMKRSSKVTAASHAIRAAVPSVPRFRPVHEEVRALLKGCHPSPNAVVDTTFHTESHNIPLHNITTQ